MFSVDVFRGRYCSSTTSSIFDLSSESERFDQALKENDIDALRKLLTVHLSRFNLVTVELSRSGTCRGVGPPSLPPAWDNWSFVDSASNRTRSLSTVSIGRHSLYSLLPSDHQQQPSSHKLSHSHPLHSSSSGAAPTGDGHAVTDDSRRDSSCGTDNPEGPVPLVFRNALHLAIQYNSMEALNLLLVSGVDPNRSGTASTTGEPSASDRASGNRERGRGDNARVSFLDDSPAHKTSTDDVFLRPLTPVEASYDRKFDPTARCSVLPRGSLRRVKSLRTERCSVAVPSQRETVLRPSECHSQKSDDAPLSGVALGAFYTSDHLFTLPPLFLAVSLRNEMAVSLLLRYGASPTAIDSRGCSPLHLSSSELFQSPTCSTALLEYGAKVHLMNHDGVAPSHLSPDLAVRQTRILREHVQLIASSAHQVALGKAGVENRKCPGSTEHSKFSAKFFRRPHLGESLRRTRANSRGRDGMPKRGKETSEKDKDSLVDRERTESVSSSKSRASNNFKVPNSTSPAMSNSDDIPMEQLVSGVNAELEKVVHRLP